MHRTSAAVVLALACGLAIAWVDSRPTWDDTGVTVGALLAVSALGGYLAPRRFWLVAAAAGLPTPLFELDNHGAFAALAFAAVGAGVGAAIAGGTSSRDEAAAHPEAKHGN